MYPVTIRFTNQATGGGQSRVFTLSVVGRSMFDDFDQGIDLSQWSSFGGVVGSTVLATNYGGCVSVAQLVVVWRRREPLCHHPADRHH